LPKCIFDVAAKCRHPELGGETSADRCAACPRYHGAPRGAGDIVHAAAKATGIARVVGDCGGCVKRRAALNRLLPLTDEPSGET
jgi:hypothetical protein